jgi:hypothetical protein
MRKTTQIIISITIIFLITTIYALKKGRVNPPPSTPTPTESAAPTLTASPTEIPQPTVTLTLTISTVPQTITPEKKTGTLTGSLSYPSEGIPKSMKVCALNLTTSQEYCTSEQIKGGKDEFLYGIGYKLEVPPGEYHVYAFLTGQPEVKAYYSEFVTCGLKYDCPSHQPIKVTVKGGQITKKVDPGDWYAPPENQP